MWNAVQRNIGGFQQVFGSKNFIIVDNNEKTLVMVISLQSVFKRNSWIKSKVNHLNGLQTN